MGIAQGQMNGSQSAPILDLDFTVQVWREGNVQTTSLGSMKRKYTQHGPPIPAQIDMLQDDLFFSQAGETEKIVAVLHFAENTDIQHADIVQVLSNRRLGDATTGIYWYIQDVVSPAAETYGFVRAHASIGKEPTTVLL